MEYAPYFFSRRFRVARQRYIMNCALQIQRQFYFIKFKQSFIKVSLETCQLRNQSNNFHTFLTHL